MAGPIAVRGRCKCGQVVETHAPKGRASWRGNCPRKGCEEVVTARRVRGAAQPPPADPPAAPARRASTIPKVGGYERATPRRGPAAVGNPDEPAARPGPTGDGGTEPSGGDNGPPAAGKPPVRAAEPEARSGRAQPYADLFGW
jgi:hypothetical protein